MPHSQLRSLSRSARIVCNSLQSVLVQLADDDIRRDTVAHNCIIARPRQIHHGGADSAAVQLLTRVQQVVEDAVEVGPQRAELVRMQTARFAAYVGAGERERTDDLRDAAYKLAVGHANPDNVETRIEGLRNGGRASQAYCVGSGKQTFQHTGRHVVQCTPCAYLIDVAQTDGQRLRSIPPFDLVQSLNGMRISG